MGGTTSPGGLEKREGPALVKVPTDLLSVENTAGVDLYIKVNGEMILYKKGGSFLPRSRIERLVRHGVRALYINREVVGSFLAITEREIKAMLFSNSKPTIQSLKKVHAKVCDLAASLITVCSSETIGLSVEVSNSIAYAMESFEELPSQVLFLLAKDITTSVHIANVHFLVAGFSYFLGYRDEELRKMSSMGMLHDVGKAFVPDLILKKPGKLNDEEFDEIKKHTVYGRDILKNDGRDNFAFGALYHHENLDGTGYPMGIKGEEIPQEAFIIKVCDIYEALTGYRTYHRPFKPFDAAKLMIEEFVQKKPALPKDLMQGFIEFVGAAKM